MRLPPRMASPRMVSPWMVGWMVVFGLALTLLVAYANHFQNAFHFDDFHTITNNAAIQHIENLPRFFVYSSLFSVFEANATYRPVTSASLALDYWLGDGYKTFFFHFSTFVWFAVLLVLMALLYHRIMESTDPAPSNTWTAILAAAVYGLHPANAETVNYIVQRGDVYDTLGVVVALLCFIAWPGQRRFGWYLIPAVLAYLSKAPALVFPLILAAYVWLYEEGADRWRQLVLPFAVTAVATIFTSAMTPAAYHGGAASGALYRLTQPWVSLHYFHMFFLPTQLTADTDWGYVDPFGMEAIAGYLFVIVLGVIAYQASRRPIARPIAFGIIWFFLALAPTALMPLGDVTNDHRMFFPFVGLTLAVFWTLRLAWQRIGMPQVRNAALVGLALVMVAEAAGTRQRNRVWHTEESLWKDVAVKSPLNPRGLMNCGAALVARGEYAEALPYLERAEELHADRYTIHVNLGMAYGGVGRDQDAVSHFEQAIQLRPDIAAPYLYYATWLKGKGRIDEAQQQFENTLRLNKLILPARHMLMEIYAGRGDREALDRMVAETLQIDPTDEIAHRFQAGPPAQEQSQMPAGQAASLQQSPEAMLHESAELCRASKFEECIAAAKKAIALRSDYPEAYNNIAAAYVALHRWDEAIQAASEAVRLNPGYELARKNLERAKALKARQQ